VNLTTRQLQAFLLVAKYRSFSRAAEQLFITPSGLSVLMRELESQLGFRLFDRNTRQVVLTPYGNDLLPVVEVSLEKIKTKIAELGRTAGERNLVLNVGATPLVAAHLLPSIIAKFQENSRGVCIRLFDGERGQIVEMVRTGSLDLGIGMFFQKPVAGVSRVSLHRFSLAVIRATSDRSIFGHEIRWSDLPVDRLIQLPADNPIQQHIDEYLVRAGHRALPEMVLNFLETQIAMVEAGAGIAIVPSFAFPACRHRKVAMTRLIDPVANFDLFKIQTLGRELPEAAETFTQFLKGSIDLWAADQPKEAFQETETGV
jgi:LysR family carnitine catabolism transcriptional activator